MDIVMKIQGGVSEEQWDAVREIVKMFDPDAISITRPKPDHFLRVEVCRGEEGGIMREDYIIDDNSIIWIAGALS